MCDRRPSQNEGFAIHRHLAAPRRDGTVASCVYAKPSSSRDSMHSSLLSRCATTIAAAVLFVAACSDSPNEPKQGPPDEVVVFSGEDQSGMAGAPLPDPIIVVVLDAAGRPVPNQAM